MDISDSTPPIAFLGVVERYNIAHDGHPALAKYNLLGLKHHIISYIYPINFGIFPYAIAIYQPEKDVEIKLVIRNQDGKDMGFFTVMMKATETKVEPSPEELLNRQDGQLVTIPFGGWAFTVIPPAINSGGLLIDKPGWYDLVFHVDGREALSAKLNFLLADVEPLTEERIAAIRSMPDATKFIRYVIKCNNCSDELKAYAGIERSEDAESKDFVWYEDLPDVFVCACGGNDLDLSIFRRNLHGFLGRPIASDPNSVNLIPLYERETLTSIKANFTTLLDANVGEEALQSYIQENPVLLNPFNCEKIFFKAPILTHHKTDFAIVTASRELILVEIEKTGTKLLKKNGDRHSELQHAVDQANNWLHEVREQRTAVLDCIGLDRKDVSGIRAVVIAGRDGIYSSEHLRRLKASLNQNVGFLTYDDLLRSFSALIERMKDL